MVTTGAQAGGWQLKDSGQYLTFNRKQIQPCRLFLLQTLEWSRVAEVFIL